MKDVCMSRGEAEKLNGDITNFHEWAILFSPPTGEYKTVERLYISPVIYKQIIERYFS